MPAVSKQQIAAARAAKASTVLAAPVVSYTGGYTPVVQQAASQPAPIIQTQPSGLAPGEPMNFAQTPVISGRGGALPQTTVPGPLSGLLSGLAGLLTPNAQTTRPAEIGGRGLAPPTTPVAPYTGPTTPGGRIPFVTTQPGQVIQPTPTTPGGRTPFPTPNVGGISNAGGTATGDVTQQTLSYLDRLVAEGNTEAATEFAQRRTRFGQNGGAATQVFLVEQGINQGRIPTFATEGIWDLIAQRSGTGLTGAELLQRLGYEPDQFYGPGIWSQRTRPTGGGGVGGAGTGLGGSASIFGGGGGGGGGGIGSITGGLNTGVYNWRIGA